jgi:hypothetical protein
MRFILFSFLIIQSVLANNVSNAFKQFYNNDLISSRHCGKNIHYFLNYLDEQNITYKSAHVVSIHEPVHAGVRHFDARWGSKGSYKNGITYSASNWYFHVFAVIDGIAYDFSQKGMKTQNLSKYLKSAYLPKFTTEKIFLVGEYDKVKALNAFKNLKLKIYNGAEYKINYGPTQYEGVFLEYFNILDKIRSNQANISNLKYELYFDNAWLNPDNSITISFPKLKIESGTYPLIASSFEICRAFGYLGSVNSKVKYRVNGGIKVLQLSSSLTNKSKRVISTSDISIGVGRFKVTEDFAPQQPLFHAADEVTCSDLESVLYNL